MFAGGFKVTYIWVIYYNVQIVQQNIALLQVLELLQEAGDDGFDTMCLLQTLGQVKTDVVDCKKGTCVLKNETETTKKEEN